MPDLTRCSELWGTAQIHDMDPKILVLRNGFYVPYDRSGAWGLFDESGGGIRESADLREGSHLQPDQILSTVLTAAQVPEQAPHGTYIYCGRINPHFGHFLVNTLPRFWAITRIRTPNTPILCHGPGEPSGWFTVPFIAAALGLLGLSPRDFVTFDRPVRVTNVVLPCTSFEEQRAAYTCYRTLCLGMGDRLRAGKTPSGETRPIYYSKSRLRAAVGVIKNESEIEDVMTAAGIEIVHPETLSFADQVRLMSEREELFGSAGSFMHASIFCPPRKITCLNVTEQLNSNYALIDKLAQNEASYYYAPDLRVEDGHPGVLTSRYLPDAASVARRLIELSRDV